jgi:uncharacterized repeat protein (TIGR03803 family)
MAPTDRPAAARAGSRSSGRRVAAVCVALLLAGAGRAHAGEAVLFSFPSNRSFSMGATPEAGLVADASGNLYGTTSAGGAFACNCGVVFRLSPPAAGGTPWTETVLHTFQGYPSDGGVPLGSLAVDAAGNLYGTTLLGGTAQAGTVFRLSPPGAGQTQWTETLLYEFSGTNADGQFPYSSLVLDAAGNLYGTSFLGGANDLGLAYELVPPASGTGRWTLVALHSFAGGGDGANPVSGLAVDPAGNLYGTTFTDGVSCCAGGTAFRLVPGGGGATEAVLHTFTATTDGAGGSAYDGGLPYGNLVLDARGNVYGTTLIGGAGQVIPGEASNAGTVFELMPPAAGGIAWREVLLHSFNGDTGDPATADGESPYGGLVFDASGNLYGTTAQGGLNDEGTVFELSPPAAGATKWTQTVLHNFSGYPDGDGPYGTLVFGRSGSLYGVTSYGTASSPNAYQIGTLFVVTP